MTTSQHLLDYPTTAKNLNKVNATRLGIPLLVATVFLSLAACVELDVVEDPQEHIVGGDEDSSNSYKKVVSIQLSRITIPPFMQSFHHCTGTVVGNRAVLTAAHCVCNWRKGGYSDSRVHFRQGSSVKDGAPMEYGGEKIRIKKVFLPLERCSEHNSFLIGADLALIQTDKPIGQVIAGKKINPGEITQFGAISSNAGDTYRLLGYGKTDHGQDASSNPQIKKIAMHMFHDEKEFEFETKPQRASSGTVCDGDSGGPIYLQGTGLVGVISQKGTANCQGRAKAPKLVGTISSRFIHNKIRELANEEITNPESTDCEPRCLGEVASHDIVWQNDDGQVHRWDLEDGVMSGSNDILEPISREWNLRGVGDVNGDDSDDLVWQHDNGQVHVWAMSDGERFGAYDVATPVGSAWKLRGVGDVNDDGTDDLVWQHDNGQVHYWAMVAGERLGGFDISAPVRWSVAGVGDVSGDGTDDILFQRSDGQVYYWEIVDGARVGEFDISEPVRWEIAGVGDVGGGRTEDILFRRDNGQVYYWQIEDGVRVAKFDIHTPVGGAWHIRGVGDLR